MIQFIIGENGKGKTTHLLGKVNAEIKSTSGNIVYLDKSTKHMFELNNKVRLISVPDYQIDNSDEFVGFICGIISQDHDLEQVYCDNFFRVAKTTKDNFVSTIQKLENISNSFHVDFYIATSILDNEFPNELKHHEVISL